MSRTHPRSRRSPIRFARRSSTRASSDLAGGRLRIGAARVDDPDVQDLTQGGMRIVDISTMPASTVMNHDRFIAFGPRVECPRWRRTRRDAKIWYLSSRRRRSCARRSICRNFAHYGGCPMTNFRQWHSTRAPRDRRSGTHYSYRRNGGFLGNYRSRLERDAEDLLAPSYVDVRFWRRKAVVEA